jgi:ADP-ribose pyrophosphatase
MTNSVKQHITGRQTVWEDTSKAFRIDELTVRTDGSSDQRWVSFERGDAVAALIVNTDTNHVILVKQFRPPIAAVEGDDHKLTETVAGMVRQNEELLQCLQRRIADETGYELKYNSDTGGLAGVEFICQFYSSPGGTSERIHLYYVAVDGETVRKSGFGIRERGESIEPDVMPIGRFLESLERAAFKDPKIIIAGQWLAKRWNTGKADGNKQEFEIRDDVDARGRRRPKARVVGYHVGDIGNVKDVDVWVNSSNTEFQMDTVYHGTLSARIRSLGAKRSGGQLVEDTIQRALERRLGMGKGIGLGNVLDTVPGALWDSNNVRCLLHVASVKAGVAPNGAVEIQTSIAYLTQCVLGALAKCDKLNARLLRLGRHFRGTYRSILLPLFGAGIDRTSSGLRTQRICEALVPAAISYLEKNPGSLIERVYFLAYTPIEVEICDSVLSRNSGLIRLKPAAPTDQISGGASALQSASK